MCVCKPSKKRSLVELSWKNWHPSKCRSSAYAERIV